MTTQGQALTATLRKSFRVNSRTVDHRDRKAYTPSIKADMLESIRNAVFYPGYYDEAKTATYRAGFGAVQAYDKHVGGYRIDGMLRFRIMSMTPWEFAALLGDMVDADVTCTGEGENYFRQMRSAA